jgi:hypothetical protein
MNLERWLEKHLGGHITIKSLTIYGYNAMHFTVRIWTRRWGYVSFHPTVKVHGRWWRWKLWVSPNATPWAATFAVGPGVRREDKKYAPIRRKAFGHNFDPEANYLRLRTINGFDESE